MRLRGRIPEMYRERVIAAAKRRGIALPADALVKPAPAAPSERAA